MIIDPITTDGERPAEMSPYEGGEPDADPLGIVYYDDAPAPVALDDEERRREAEWEKVYGR